MRGTGTELLEAALPPHEESLHLWKASSTPTVLLPASLSLEHPRIPLMQVFLPNSLPPMEVLRIVSFCLLLNV